MYHPQRQQSIFVTWCDIKTRWRVWAMPGTLYKVILWRGAVSAVTNEQGEK